MALTTEVSVDDDQYTSLQDPRFKAKLQQFRQLSNAINIWYLIRTYLFFAIVIGGTLWFYQIQGAQGVSWWWNVPVTLLAVVLVGAGQHQMTALSHEASHHILFTNRYMNDLVSDLFCMFPLFSTTHHYRLQHIAHHQFVNDPKRDPDISQLQTSGHWLNFPLTRRQAFWSLIKQLWPLRLFRFMRIRAAYNSIPTDKNPYLKKGWKPTKWPVRIGMLYMLSQIALLTTFVRMEAPLLLATIPTALFAAVFLFYAFIPANLYHQSRVHPVISLRTMSLLRVTYITATFMGLALLSLYVTPYATLYYFLLWILPIFTSFSFFMILRQIVQHGNGGRGWLTNTRTFYVHPFIRFSVFPLGQEFHLPHHLYATIPHYRLRRMHEELLKCPEYREEGVEVHGYFVSTEKPQVHPTVLDVLGPDYVRYNVDVYIDNEVLEQEEVEEKDDILKQGEMEIEQARRERGIVD